MLFALSAHGHAGCDGIVKVKAVTRLSNSVDVVALEQYVERLLPAFWRGRLVLEGVPPDSTARGRSNSHNLHDFHCALRNHQCPQDHHALFSYDCHTRVI